MISHEHLRDILKALLIIAIIFSLSAGCGGAAIKVQTSRVGFRSIEQKVMVAGKLEPTNPTQVMPAVSGSISEIYVTEGQEVAAGQPLVQLDTSVLEQALLSARGSLESIRSLSQMLSGFSSAAAGMGRYFDSLLSRIDASIEETYNFKKTLIRYLPEDQRLEALQAIEKSYQSYLECRKESRPPAISVGGGYSSGAQQAAAKKAIENAEKNLKAATIKAPVSGTVVTPTAGGASIESMLSTMMSSLGNLIPSGLDLSALTGISGTLGTLGFPSTGPLVPGSYVIPGSPIFTIVDLKRMTLVTKVTESDIAKIRVGMDATVRLEAYPDKSFKARVTKIANTSTVNEAGAVAFEVRLEIEPADVDLKIGMTGTGDVVVAKKKATIVLPIEALIEKEGRKYVFRVVDGKAKLTEVRTGVTTESDVEITEGVRAGDRIVVKGVEKIREGQTVKF